MDKALSKKIAVFQKKIFEWYSSNGRAYPWRYLDDPYKVFISEILLQKTTSEQVSQIYSQFVDEFPDINKIIKAKNKQILKYFETLGMGEKKTKVLKEVCLKIKQDFNGLFPDDQETLLSLPGIGKYSANAILCFAYGKPMGILDTNVVRILERVFNLKSDKSRARTDLNFWEFSTSLVPTNNPKDFNYGLLDFSALVCKKRNPLCDTCIVKTICSFFGFSVGRSNK